jgi:hypothetical protein
MCVCVKGISFLESLSKKHSCQIFAYAFNHLQNNLPMKNQINSESLRFRYFVFYIKLFNKKKKDFMLWICEFSGQFRKFDSGIDLNVLLLLTPKIGFLPNTAKQLFLKSLECYPYALHSNAFFPSELREYFG